MDRYDRTIKEKMHFHHDNLKIMKIEYDQKVSEAIKKERELEDQLIGEKNELQKEFEMLNEFEKNKTEIDKEISNLEQEYEMERAKITEKLRENQREAHLHAQEILKKRTEGKDIEEEKIKLEYEKKKGVYELEGTKVENQKAIDEKRKATQRLGEKNKGK